jgi:hypothetical protein
LKDQHYIRQWIEKNVEKERAKGSKKKLIKKRKMDWLLGLEF